MGKTQSREGPQGPYVVHTLPSGYHEVDGLRAKNGNNNVVVYRQSHRPPESFSRTQSLYSLPASEATMASRNWRPGLSRKDIVEKKASYLGRFQTVALTETALANLRSVIYQSQLKKTKIKLSPVGLSFGTKTTGVLQPDKVAYRFFRIEDIESIRLDNLDPDVLLCISRTNDEHALIQNGQTAVIHRDNYEINTFSIDPKDGRVLERAALDFKNRLLAPGSYIGDGALRGRSMTLPQADIVDYSRGPRTIIPAESRGWVLAQTKAERNGRHLTVENHARNGKQHVVEHRKLNRHSLSEGLSQPSPTYIYNGTLADERTIKKRTKHHDAGVSAYFPGSEEPVSPSGMHCLATRVYFDKHGGAAKADVECQAKPTQVTKTSASDSMSRISLETSSEQRTSRSSSRNGSNSKKSKDQMKKRMNDLSREMERLRSLMDSDDVDARVEDSSSSSSDSTVFQANGSTLKSVSPRHETHVGTIDTRAGMVDVIVDHAPYKQTSKTTTKREVLRADVKKTHHNGYVTGTKNTHVMSLPRSRGYYNPDVRNNGGQAPNGRIAYYRPVSPQPTRGRTAERNGAAQKRSRSTEPPKSRKGKSSKWLF